MVMTTVCMRQPLKVNSAASYTYKSKHINITSAAISKHVISCAKYLPLNFQTSPHTHQHVDMSATFTTVHWPIAIRMALS